VESLSTRHFSRAYVLVTATVLCLSPLGSQALLAQVRRTVPETYSGVSVETSQQVFATMCALDAAGFGSDESTLAEMPARRVLRADLLKLQGPATEALRKFYREHALGDPGENLSRYMAFALVAGPSPEFQFQVERDLLPPDVLSLDGFQAILAAFYREAHLDARWHQVEREYEYAALQYQLPVARVITVSNGYLREVAKPSRGRSFFVYVEPLVGNRTIFRNTGDRYAIVVGNTPEFPTDEIRHAYLHFLLDPLPLTNRGIIERKAALLNIAAKAPQLPREYQGDFLALTDECFVKAVDLRVQRLSPDRLEAAVKDADRSGFILVRPIVQQLQKFEKDQPAMSYYFSDLIDAIDVQAEQKRLQRVTFYMSDMTAASKDTGLAENDVSDLDKLMDQGDREIALQDAPAAEATFQKVLKEDPSQPRALYGLAIASVLDGKAAVAKDLFQKVVSPVSTNAISPKATAAPEPMLLAWSHIYLGRIHDLEGERDLAIGEYKAALAVDGAPESALVAAQRGVGVAYAPPANSGGNAPRKP
jgi:tetratricopeptide (TPR) repeat protein